MKFKKDWPVYLTYASIPFLIYALYKADYLFIPKIFSVFHIIFSVLFLIGGFLLHALGWQATLRSNNQIIKYRDSLESFGLSILTKYIPGKVWMIFGMSGHINRKYKYSIGSLLTASLNFQFITLWSSLFVGNVGLLFIDISIYIQLLLLFSFIILSATIFNNKVYKTIKKVIYKISSKKIDIPFIHLRDIVYSSAICIMVWALYGIAFMLLIIGLTGEPVGFQSIFTFPLATAVGILAVFAPGGIGVRESIITVYLMSLDINLETAITVSIVSRLWFFIGELLTFTTAFLSFKIFK